MSDAELERTVFRLRDAARPAADDAELLGRFAAGRDHEAFAELVRRYAPLVAGLCRRVLGHVQDAEDAAQATFIVLARKAGAIRPASAVGRWLYGVAWRTARKARCRRERLRRHERAAVAARPPGPAEAEARDWLPVLDEQLARLSERDRAPIVLCDLLQRSRREAAEELGIAEGTLSSRLARSRQKLRQRLERRGVTLSAAALAGALESAAGGGPVGLPVALRWAPANVLSVAACDSAANILAGEVTRTMFRQKLAVICAGVLVVVTAVVLPAGLADKPGGAPETATKREVPKGTANTPPAAAKLERLRQLLKDRVEAARRAAGAEALERVRLGKDPVLVAITAFADRTEAELDIATTREGRLRIREESVTRLKDLEDVMVDREERGTCSATELFMVRQSRLKAEILLEREKAAR